MMEVVCIRDNNRPSQIPEHLWPKKGKVYEVVRAVQLSVQVGKIGFVIKGLELGESCFPYHYHDAERFVPKDMYEGDYEYSEIQTEIALDI